MTFSKLFYSFITFYLFSLVSLMMDTDQQIVVKFLWNIVLSCMIVVPALVAGLLTLLMELKSSQYF